jgi:hypothetical protein
MLKTATGAVITVSPDIDGDDTDDLMAAFTEAKAAGPGSTVKLTASEFHIGFLFDEDFDGTFSGAGMGETIIEPLPNLNCDELNNANLSIELIRFLRGNIRITDMSFMNPEGEPCPGGNLWEYIGFHDWAYNELPNLPQGHKINAVVDQFEFDGRAGPSGGYTVGQVIGCGTYSGSGMNIPY